MTHQILVRHYSFLCALCVAALLLISCAPNPTAVRARADHFYQSGKYADAAIQYRKLIQIDASNGEARYRLGQTYLKLGQFDEAYQNLKTAVGLLPSREDVAAELADMLLTSFWNDASRPQAVYKELKSLADAMLKRNSKSYSGHRVSGYLALLDRRFHEAKQQFTEALAAQPGDRDATAMLIQVLFDMGDTSAAEQLAQQYISRYRDAFLIYEILAREYTKKGRPESAEQILSLQISNNPKMESARMRLAEHYLTTGKQHQMTRVLNEMLDQREIFPNARLRVGEFYQRIGRLNDALSQFEAGAIDAADGALAYRKRQIPILIIQSRFKEARALLAQTLSNHDNDRDLRRARALLLLEADGQIDAAIAELRALVEANAEDHHLHHDLGRALIRKGDDQGAQAELELVRRLAPRFLPARIALAGIFLRAGRFEEALRETDSILQFSPDNEIALLGRVAAFRSLGLFEEARTILRQLSARIGPSETLDIEKAYLLLATGPPEQAETLFRKLYRKGHPNIRVVAGFIESLTAQLKYDEAIRVLESDLLELPDRAMVRFALAETWARKGESRRASEEFKKLISQKPDLVAAYERLSQLYAGNKQVDLAIALLRNANSRMPSNPRIVGALAQILDMAGRGEEALQLYREWLKIESQNPVPANNLAYLLADRTESLDEAFQLARTAVQNSPQNPACRDTLGYVYLRKGEKSAALQILKALTAQYPGNVVFRYHYALALLETGDKAASKSELERVLKLSPPEMLRLKVLEAVKKT